MAPMSEARHDLDGRVAGRGDELGQVRLPGHRDRDRARQDELLDAEDPDDDLPGDQDRR